MSLDFIFFSPPDVNTLTKWTVFNLQLEKKVKELLMWRIILTAVRSISLAGWTRLYSWPPGRLFVWTMWGIHIIHVLSSPDKHLHSCLAAYPSFASSYTDALWLLMFEMAVWWKKYKNDRTAVTIPLWIQGYSCGLCLKTLQLFTPHSPMSCLFSWLIVFSL